MSRSPVVILAVAALAAGALAGCSSASDPSVAPSAAMSGQSAGSAAPSEEALKQQVEKDLSVNASPEMIVAALRSNTQLAQLENLGLDLEGIAAAVLEKTGFEVSDVRVEGETAVATIHARVPDLNADAAAKIQESLALKVAEAGIDPAAPDEARLVGLVSETITEFLAGADLATKTGDFTVDYAASDGKWAVKDPAAFEKAVADFMGAPQI